MSNRIELRSILQLLIASFFSLHCLGFEFRQVIPWGASPLHRYGHTMVELGASAVVFGGSSQSVLLNDLWVFNGMSSTWASYTPIGACLSPRFFHAAAKLSLNSLIISGGLSNISRSSSSLVLSDAFLVHIDAQRSFRCTPLANLPVPLYGHSMASTKLGIILFGGYSRPDSGVSHVWLLQNASSDQSAKWLLLSASGNPPSPRAFFVSGLLQADGSTSSIFVVWGGLSITGETQTPLFTLTHDEQQPVESGWRWSSPVLKGSPPAPRAYAASVYTSKTLCIHGGQSSEGGVLRDLWFLDRDIAGFYTWKLQSMPVPAPAVWGHTLTVFETSNQMLFYGGRGAAGVVEHRMFAYFVARGATAFIDFAGNVPAARHSAAMGCLGSRLILHGGVASGAASGEDYSSSNPMNDMWQFHLSNAQWSLLRPLQLTAAINASVNQSFATSNSSNATAAPAASNSSLPTVLDDGVPRLFGHSMLTLGPIFIIFGGFSRSASSGALTKPDNQIYSFNPRRGEWRKLQPSTPVIPAARAFHAHAAGPSSTLSTSLVIFGGIGSGKQVLGDAWVIPLSLFQPLPSAKGNVTDRMIAFDFNCRHVSFDSLTMKPFGSFSVSFWIFASVMPGEEQFLVGSASQRVKSAVDFSIYALPDSCALQVSLNVADRLHFVTGAGKTSICDPGWHHVAFTFNGTSRQGVLYIDGLPDAELTASAAAAVTFRNTFFIGHLPSASRLPASRSCWSGFIDRFSFWNVSLTPSQVSSFQFNSSNAFLHFNFDVLDFSSAASIGSGMIQAFAYFGSGQVALAPALLPSSCPTSLSELSFNISLHNPWSRLPSGPGNRSHAMMTSVSNGDIFLFGGRDAAGASLSDLWILRNFDVPSLAQWQSIVPVQNMASPMSHAIIGSLGPFQAVVFGYNSSSESQVSLLADIGGYEKAMTRQYFDVRMPPAVGVAHSKCIDNTLWAFGGLDAVLQVPFDGLFRSDLTSPFVPVQGSGFSPPSLLDPRYCQVNSTSILLVGRSSLSGAQESHLFTMSSHQWLPLSSIPELSLDKVSLVSIEDSEGPSVIAFGGYSSSAVAIIRLGSNMSSRFVTDSSQPRRTRHAALSYSGFMWIFGGQSDATPAAYFSDLWTFSPQNVSWALVTPASSLRPPPIVGHTFHPVLQRAVAIGGQVLSAATAALVPNMNVWVFDFASRSWSSAPIPNFAPCFDMAAASQQDYLYVYGGHSVLVDEVSASIWIADTRGNVSDWVWKSFRTVGPEPRSAAFLGVLSSSLLLYGGLSNSVAGLSLTDMWEYGIDVADPAFCKVFGPNSKVAYAGVANYFDIELRNVFNNVIGNSVFNSVDFWLLYTSNSTRFRGTIEHRADTIRVIFTPQYVGPHTAFLELNHGTISLSYDNQPFSINVLASEVDASTSDFHLLFPNGSAASVDSTLLVAAGDPLVFEIGFQDKLNNVGEYLGRIFFYWYKIKIVPGTESSGNPVEYLDSTGTPPVELKASGAGSFHIVGTLLEVANYSIIVKMGNQLVGGVTYNFTLLSAALDPQSSLVLVDESTSYDASAQGARRYPVGETVRIVVLLRDRFGNNITYALDDNFFVVRITGSDIPPLEVAEGKTDPLPEQVQRLLSASSYENDAFSLVLSDVVIEGVLLPKRIIRFFPFSLGDYRLHLATADGEYLAGFPLVFNVFPVFTGYTDKQTMLRIIVSAPISALACGFLCAFLLSSLKKHLQARAEKAVSAAPKFTREQIKSLPPTEIVEVLIKLRYIKAQHRPALLKMLDEGNTKIWNFFDVFFSSTKGHNLALATLGGNLQRLIFDDTTEPGREAYVRGADDADGD